MTIHRLLITGAAGALGKQLRERLAGAYPVVRLSDVAPMDPARAGEEVMPCDLADAAAVDALCEGVDAIVHLGGQSTEAGWERIIQSNVLGAINLYESARKAKVDRVLFATSNHAVGMYRRSLTIDDTAIPRPDSRYGFSKAMGEQLATFYAYKFGVKAFSMRIGSCFPEPTNRRMLSTWMSYEDFVRLVQVGLTADYVNEIVYGISRNTRSWWDNSNAYRLGYDPQDDAETFAGKVAHIVSDDPLEEALVGGGYARPDFTGSLDAIP